MAAMLRAATQEDTLHGSHVVRRSSRHPAVEPNCTRGAACRLSRNLTWSERTIYHELEGSFTKRFPDARRSGAVGAWLSHLSAYEQVLRHGPPLLLVLEDDVVLHPSFFPQLPCLLAALPATGEPWHAVRFSTWGRSFGEDLVDAIAQRGGTPRAYRARTHPYDGSGMAAFPYGGAHAVLVQRATAGELIGALVANGVMAIDVALREAPKPTAPRSDRSQATAARRLRSFVVQTDLVSVDANLRAWRLAPNGNVKGAAQAPAAAETAYGKTRA